MGWLFSAKSRTGEIAQEAVKRKMTVFLKIGLVFCSTLIGIVISEIILVSIGYYYKPIRIKAVDHKLKAFEDTVCEYDHDLIWVPRKDISVFNSQGFRGDVLSDNKEPGTYRIFTLGDSNTIGKAGLKHNPNYPMYLEEMLNRNLNRKKYVVINAGVWGYTSFQGLRRLRQILPYKPDIVTINFGCNDAILTRISDKDFSSSKIKEKRIDEILVKMKVGQLLLSILDVVYVKGHYKIVPRVSVEEYRENMEEMIKQTKGNGALPILITRPYRGKSGNGCEGYNNAVRDIGKEDGILVIDQRTCFINRDEYFSDDIHFNEEGYRFAAEQIYDEIKKLIK